MYVVPLAGDTIITSDGGAYDVISYTNFKKAPAVYVETAVGEASHVVYFFDIEKINGVKVDLDLSAKVFKSLGKLKRKYHLPQPGDTITVLKKDTALDSPDDEVEVEKIKLHNKAEGVSKGLLFCDEKSCYRLIDVLGISRNIGSDFFDRKKFLKYYQDYLGIRG